MDIDLIQDEANVAAPRREAKVEVPPLGDDLVVDVEHMQESAAMTPVYEVGMTPLFGNDMPPVDASRVAGKRPHSDRTSNNIEAQSDDMLPPDASRAAGKRIRSCHTSDDAEA
uniref:Integrase core domain containing protein n=1 Tax=Solanum tuberosum TaxID=4113 RepID=M1DC31_SOLTU